MLKTYPPADDSSAPVAAIDHEQRIRDAISAGLALIGALRMFPFSEPDDYALLRDAARLATEREAAAASVWRGAAPDWAPHACSTLHGITWIGKRLTCMAAAAAGTTWDADDFVEAIAKKWSDVQQFVSREFQPVPTGVLESGLQREARETAELPICVIPRTRWSDGGWLEEQVAAYELAAHDEGRRGDDPQPQKEQPPPPALTQKHFDILAVLKLEFPRTVLQNDIVTTALFDRKSVGTYLSELRSWGYVERPRGPREGDRITKAGLALLKKQVAAH